MTGRIHVLPDSLVNRIAAGEVVERPSAVLKELIDNALDAAATRIEIGIEAAGVERITVADDGEGMTREDAVRAFERHATSKIASEADLAAIRWLGFRGEALPSIAAVSRLTLETSPAAGEGTRLRIEGGDLGAVEAVARGRGTTVDVRGLFYNTPARREFLKTPTTEQASNFRRLLELTLARLDVGWQASHGGREILSLAPARTLAERLAVLHGPAYVDTLLPLEGRGEGVEVRGLTQRPVAAGASRRRQFVFVNGRPIDAPELLQAVLRGYRSAMAAGARPDVYLFLDVEPHAVDVNVHPAKREVRFRDPAAVAQAVEDAARRALGTPAAAGRVLGERPLRVAERGRSVGGGDRPPADQLGMFFGARRRDPASSDSDDDGRTAVVGRIEHDPERSEAGRPAPGLWQLHARYILAQTARGLVIIDQHSAHERILYEEVIAGLREGIRPGQRLLFPIVLHLSPEQRATWEEYRGLIDRLGFEIEPFGGDAVAVSAIPAFRHTFDPEAALAGLLDDLAAPGGGSADMNQHERVARLFSCKAAIKAGQPLRQDEMIELIDRLFATRLPYDDVHGRPAVMQIGLDDLNRQFGRH
ncbi:MAG TPA: DNA mismatch repair endonuclease MutL [Gemmatimonadota bacterium]|nr:DNA mismatch repair endonuclease MutL [Gemmatimonadota bacterium]